MTDAPQDALAALAELVACKELKEQIEAMDAMDADASYDPAFYTMRKAEYERRKPLAWANARALLSARESRPAGEADALTDGERKAMIAAARFAAPLADLDTDDWYICERVFLAGKHAAAPMKREPQMAIGTLWQHGKTGRKGVEFDDEPRTYAHIAGWRPVGRIAIVAEWQQEN